MIDGLVLGLVAYSILKSKYAAPADIGLTEFYWMVLAAGFFLVRWAYLAWSYFYGENANKNPSLLFKIHRAWVTFGGVCAFATYFVIIFVFLL